MDLKGIAASIAIIVLFSGAISQIFGSGAAYVGCNFCSEKRGEFVGAIKSFMTNGQMQMIEATKTLSAIKNGDQTYAGLDAAAKANVISAMRNQCYMGLLVMLLFFGAWYMIFNALGRMFTEQVPFLVPFILASIAMTIMQLAFGLVPWSGIWNLVTDPSLLFMPVSQMTGSAAPVLQNTTA